MSMPVHQAQSPYGRDELAWTATGRGTPLLLIAGLGLGGSSWWRSVTRRVRSDRGRERRRECSWHCSPAWGC